MKENKETWIEEFEDIYVRDANFFNPADEIRTKWLVPYVDSSAEQLKDFISKLISQEKEKWNEDVYFNATNIARMAQQTVGEKNDLYITLQQLEGMMSDL